MLLPPFLLVADDAGRVQAMTVMLTRIGLANEVRVSPTLSDAKAYLRGCATSRLPVIVLTRAIVGEETGVALIEWMRGQADAIAALDVIALVDEAEAAAWTGSEELGAILVREPVEMRELIAAMKSLALPEQARIDPATLMVRVELWPRPGGVSRQ